MSYNRNPPAPLRFIEGQPIQDVPEVGLVFPSIANVVRAATAPREWLVECDDEADA